MTDSGPASELQAGEGVPDAPAEAARPPLAIGVRLSNVRAEVIAREAVHE